MKRKKPRKKLGRVKRRVSKRRAPKPLEEVARLVSSPASWRETRFAAHPGPLRKYDPRDELFPGAREMEERQRLAGPVQYAMTGKDVEIAKMVKLLERRDLDPRLAKQYYEEGEDSWSLEKRLSRGEVDPMAWWNRP